MSQYPTTPASTYQDGGTSSYPASGTDQPQPTFTPTVPTTEGTPATADTAVATTSTTTRTGTASAQETSHEDDAPVMNATPAVDESRTAFAADASSAALPVDEPTAAFRADEPLLANAAAMRASWQKVQAEFVDDPQAAVMDAADLIEQTAQSLVDALRQRQLRLQSDRGTGNGGGTVAGAAGYDPAAAGGAPDTERLRLMMQRYRTLFDQLCSA